MKTRYLLLGVAMAALVAAQPLHAASTTANLTVNAAVAARAVLVLGSSAINFADQNPTDVPSIGATENPVDVTARGRTTGSGTVTLTLQANGANLVSGTDTIAINNVSWTATGAFSPGTMNSASAVTVGSWMGSNERTGTMSFFLANSWAYATGTYTQTATFTLTAP